MLISPSVFITQQLGSQQVGFYHYHVREGLGVLDSSLIFQMKLILPSLPLSPYVSFSFRWIFIEFNV
jgi:hypothetical protein